MPTVPWIRLYTSWPRHRKTMALRRILGTAEPILELWCWASENAPNGDLTGIDPSEIEMAAGWRGKRGKCFEAMVQAGFVDASDTTVRLHDWMEMTGAGVESLKIMQEGSMVRMHLRRDASLMKVVKDRDQSHCRYCDREVDWGDRRGPGGGTYDHVQPISKGGSNSPENVVVACRSCNAKKKDRTPEEAGMVLKPSSNLLVKTESKSKQEEIGEEKKIPSLDSGSSSLSASDPDQTRDPGATKPKTANDWLSYFQVKYWEIRKRQYGRGTADAKALGNFGELLDSLPVEQRSEDWLARERIVTEFLNRSDVRTVSAGWPFCFFATDFRGLALPPDKRPKPEPRQPHQRPGQPEPFYWPDLKGAGE